MSDNNTPSATATRDRSTRWAHLDDTRPPADLDLTGYTDLPLPGFTRYRVSPIGDVVRVVPFRYGRFAGSNPPIRVVPVKHPKGLQWYVQLQHDDGTRHRVPLRLLVSDHVSA